MHVLNAARNQINKTRYSAVRELHNNPLPLKELIVHMRLLFIRLTEFSLLRL